MLLPAPRVRIRQKANAGEQIFYDIYSEQEKESDPAKKDTGIFFFKGTSSAKYTICNAGDGFVYAGAMVSVSVPERLRKAG